jgi:hypothetical protein
MASALAAALLLMSAALARAASAEPVGALAIMPSTLSFGDVTVGTGASQFVTVTNTGSATVAITTLTVSNAAFSADNECPATLAPGANCTIEVTFDPSVAGASSGTLTIVDSTSAEHTVALTGVGAASVGAITVMPTSIDFGAVLANQDSATETVVVSNTGDGPVSGLGVAISGPFSESSGCPVALDSGDSCTVSVVFDPTAAGAASGQLSIMSNAPGSPQTVALSGTGILPVLDCSKASASNPDLTAFPLVFLPEQIRGVTDSNGGSITQDKPVAGGLLICQDGFGAGTGTAWLRDDNQGGGGLIYTVGFTATDKAGAGSCTGTVQVCVQDLLHQGRCADTGLSFDATICVH